MAAVKIGADTEDPDSMEQGFSVERVASPAAELATTAVGPFVQSLGSGEGAKPLVFIFIVGKCGNGKSSVGNTIVGDPGRFETKRSATSVTLEMDFATLAPGSRPGPGAPLVVVDCPGLSSPTLPSEVLGRDLRHAAEALDKCCARAGVRAVFAIILVLGVHSRITNEDLGAIGDLRKTFGKRFLGNTVVAWTHGDLLTSTIDAYLSEQEGIQELVQLSKTCPSVVVNNNLDPASAASREQVAALLDGALSVAGPLPKPKGKEARRLRQAELQRPDHQVFLCNLL